MRRGFTIIELVVTIAIMGILVGFGLNTYNRSLMSSRNNRRQVDIEKIRQGLERYRSDDPNHFYPANPNELVTVGIMLEMPKDPQTNMPYTLQYFLGACIAVNQCSDYQLSIPLEPAGTSYVLANPREVRIVTTAPVAPTAIPQTP